MWQKIIKDRRLVGLLTLLIIVAAVPLTLSLTQEQQDIRQRAAESTPPVCTETGTDIVLIIDKSNSMNNPSSPTDTQTRFQRAKLAAKNFADILAQKNASLPESKKHKLAIASFSNSVLTKIDSELTTNMSAVKNSIDALQPGDDATGWTCIECGIVKANLELSSGRQRQDLKNVAILLTDGKANWLDGGTSSVSQSTAEYEAMNEVMTGFRNLKISYFTIGLGTQQEISEVFLKNVASSTNGKYYYAPTAVDLQGIYTQISQVLGKGSIGGFVYNDTNSNQTWDSSEQKLSSWQLSLTQENTTIATTTTDNIGNYTFQNVCDGSYQVRLTMKPGWKQVSPPNSNPISVSLTSAGSVMNNPFGVRLQHTPTTLSCSPTTLTLTDNTQIITAVLKDSNGTVLPNQPISWRSSSNIVAVTSSSTTNTAGTATTSVRVTNNPDTEISGKITASFAGDSNNAPSTCEVPINYSPKATILSMTLFLHGIGSGGDNANSTDVSLGNRNPKRPVRPVTIQIYNDTNKLVHTSTQQESFSTAGHFPITRNIGANFPTGKYSILVTSPGYLTRKVPSIVTVTSQGTTELGKIALITGDIDKNNSLNILDFDLLGGCYSDYSPPISCNSNAKTFSDMNDDGKVDQFDYNLFLRELSVQDGDKITPN